MNSLDFVQATYGMYTVLIIQKYLGALMRRARKLDDKLFAEEPIVEELVKKESNGYISQVKQWVIATTGIAAVYFTGSMQYVLPILNVVITGKCVLMC